MSSQTGLASSSTMDDCGDSAEGSSKPRQRSSKACEGCRARRIKCIGGVPCDACTAIGIGADCEVRAKARPKRALSSKLPDSVRHRSDASQMDQAKIRRMSSTMPLAATGDRVVLPLDDVNIAMVVWCLENDVGYDDLCFNDENRLKRLQSGAPPLPEPVAPFEDQLIRTFVDSPEFDHLRWIDKPKLLSMYARYRAIPNSVTDDQKALIFAAFCLARFNQIHSRREGFAGSDSATTLDEIPMEDVTYFSMAFQCLVAWSRPSIYSLWALFCLVPYTMAQGGAMESRDLLEQMAWHVKELGIHYPETAALYPAQDMVEVIFSAFVYTDTFSSGLLERPPCLPVYNIHVDPMPSSTMFPDALRQVTLLEMRFLRDIFDPSVETTSREYIDICESHWVDQLKLIRSNSDAELTHSKRLWAELRYCWLRILLYSPGIVIPGRNLAPISRAISQMLHIYADADSIGHFRESWQQLRQLSTCAHLLILCHAAGEFHSTEATRLWHMLIGFLERHQVMWPAAVGLCLSLRKAAGVFGMILPTATTPAPVLNALLPVESDSIFDPWNSFFPFDFGPNATFPFDTVGEDVPEESFAENGPGQNQWNQSEHQSEGSGLV